MCIYISSILFTTLLIRTHTKRLRVSFFVLEIPRYYLNGIIVVIILIYSYSVPLRIFVCFSSASKATSSSSSCFG